MHEDVTAEDEGVGVDLGDDTATACSDVSKDAVSFGIVAKRLEVEVINRWALGLVKRWSRSGDVLNV